MIGVIGNIFVGLVEVATGFYCSPNQKQFMTEDETMDHEGENNEGENNEGEEHDEEGEEEDEETENPLS